jgi:4-hydroxy-tetrahydrodipicolinate reductase
MGQRIIQLAREDRELQVAAALEMPGHPQLGRDVGEVVGAGAIGVYVSNLLPPELRVDVLIDFSTPEGTMAVLPLCLERKVPLVVATTGHTHVQKAEIEGRPIHRSADGLA